MALHVYRIAEEAVANALKHSKATKITIELQMLSGGKAALTIGDNGKGFRRTSGFKGMGLQNMKYRAGVHFRQSQDYLCAASGYSCKVHFPLKGQMTLSNAQTAGKDGRAIPKPANPDDVEVPV